MKLAAASWVNAAEPLLEREPKRSQQLIGRGLQLEPQLAAAYFNLGLALHQQGRPDAAIRAYRQALRLAGEGPVAAAAQRNLAQDLLLQGNFREGWNLYEERLLERNHEVLEAAAGSAWGGIWDPRPLKRLLLIAEQGFGDTLMFSRLGLWLQQELGVPVQLICQGPLVELLRRGSDLSTVSAGCQPSALAEPGTRWCPLMSLPQRMHLKPSGMRQQKPYLRVEAERIALWRQRLQRRRGRALIALHWQGNPRHEGSLYSRGRSIPFSALTALGQLGSVEFVSVQKGAGAEQLRLDAGLEFVRGQAEVSASMDFIDTAAVLSHCDLLISADSGVVHLAGAMGRPAWLALRDVPEWRWGLQGQRTPWYPSVQLFRQPSYGDWESVLTAMIDRWRQRKR